MSDSPNKLFQFWQELKRRNVLRSLAIYAGSAFIILEATTIIFPRWGFPDWTIDLVLYLLILGAFINIVVAWIFDITPDGVQKTKPSSELKEGEKTVVSNSWRIATYVSVVVIIGLILLNIFNLSKVSESLTQYGKSIAVLPFINDTQDKENDQFISGTRESILNNLSKIKDLRVVTLTSVEQYRDTIIPIPKVAEEQRVSYVLKGSMQKYGDHIRITLQLIDQNDRLLWSEQYDREIKEAGQYFTFWSEIAQLVAEELKVVITPEEKELIEKIPTTSLTAYDFYQRGREEHIKYWTYGYREGLEKAEYLYYRALEYDSTFALAYTGLGYVYRNSHRLKTFMSENFLDSTLTLAEIALSFDDQLAEAYLLRGDYYRDNNKRELAINDYDKAIKLNPNLYRGYWERGHMYESDGDFVNAIENYLKAASLRPGPSFLSMIYPNLCWTYANAGFKEKANYYIEETFKLEADSFNYIQNLANLEYCNGNYEKAIEFWERLYAIDSNGLFIILPLGRCHMWLDQFEESLEYWKKYENRIKNLDRRISGWALFRIGYVYWVNGFKEEAKYYFDTGFEIIDKMIELDRPVPYLTLAAIYAFLGDNEKAYENLWLHDRSQTNKFTYIAEIKNDPMFDNIRDESEFQQIVHSMETKYQAEHERVRKWLEENDRCN